MNTILRMIDEITKTLEDADRVPATVFIELSELREEVKNYKCIHQTTKEWANEELSGDVAKS